MKARTPKNVPRSKDSEERHLSHPVSEAILFAILNGPFWGGIFEPFWGSPFRKDQVEKVNLCVLMCAGNTSVTDLHSR